MRLALHRFNAGFEHLPVACKLMGLVFGALAVTNVGCRGKKLVAKCCLDDVQNLLGIAPKDLDLIVFFRILVSQSLKIARLTLTSWPEWEKIDDEGSKIVLGHRKS